LSVGGTRRRNISSTNRGKTKRVSHIAVLIPKPTAVMIKLRPKRIKTPYSKSPRIRKAPPISAEQDVNQDPEIIRNSGILLFKNVLL
jgi:hypothetical protein